MKFIQLVLRRPMSIITLILGVVVFGSASLTGMPLEYMPDMEMPMELVMITWPGADADSVDRLLTQPMEDECESLSDLLLLGKLHHAPADLSIRHGHGRRLL